MNSDSIERFRRGFWNKETLARPVAAVCPDRIWAPVSFLRQPFPREHVGIADTGRALVRTEYEICMPERRVPSDDWIPFAAAWRAIPWLEAMSGCAVRYASGSLAPERFVSTAAALRDAEIPAGPEWIERLALLTAELQATAPDDCWVSTTILRGCSDVLAAMRGLNEFCLDLYDDPGAVAEAAARVNALHRRILDRHFATVKPKHGGYGHIFGYWAPGPTTVVQEDIMGLCAPSRYRDLFQRHTAELVEHLGPYTLFHLHSTGYLHYRHVLDIPGIAGLELTVEANGPTLAELTPALRKILERSRLILMIDGHFEELAATLLKLPKEGLYLSVSSRFVPDEKAFEALVS